MKSNYIKIFICALIAAGFVCLIAGVIIFFAVSGTSGILVGIVFIVTGASDTIISLFVLLIFIINDKLKKSNHGNNNQMQDKKD